MVVPQQTAQSLAATNVGAKERAGRWRNQIVAEALMVPLPMVVRHELPEYVAQAPFPEENQAVQTLLANRPHEPFRVGVGVRRLDRSQDHTHPRLFEEASESRRRSPRWRSRPSATAERYARTRVAPAPAESRGPSAPWRQCFARRSRSEERRVGKTCRARCAR